MANPFSSFLDYPASPLIRKERHVKGTFDIDNLKSSKDSLISDFTPAHRTKDKVILKFNIQGSFEWEDIKL